MQEMSKFTAFKYTTPVEEYTEKQQEVIDTIREIVKKTKDTSTHCITIYDKTKKKLKRKKLHKELTEHELLELCNDVWAARLCGLEY
jgi:hypothetical protein